MAGHLQSVSRGPATGDNDELLKTGGRLGSRVRWWHSLKAREHNVGQFLSPTAFPKGRLRAEH